MADMVVAAGVDAAGDVEENLADCMLPVEVGETLADHLRDRDAARGGERAVIHPRAGDDVADEADVRRGEAGGGEPPVQRRQVFLADMRQHQVLHMRHPDFAEGMPLRQRRDRVHLRRAGIARDAADGLQADGHAGIAGGAVRAD